MLRGFRRRHYFIVVLITLFLLVAIFFPAISYNSNSVTSIKIIDENGVDTGEKGDNCRSSRQNQVDDWPLFRHDMQRTGNTTSLAPNNNKVLWKHQVPVTQYTWGYCGSPAVAGGFAYQGGNRPDVVRSINADTGGEKWQTPVGGRVTSSPTISSNRVLFTAYDKKVYSLDIANGVLDWSTPTINWPDSSPTVANGLVYVGDGAGDYVGLKPAFLYCLEEKTGVERWRFTTNGQIVSSPTIFNNVVIFGSYDGNVYALPAVDPNGDGWMDISEGIWRFDAGSRVVTSAAVMDNTVFMGTWDGYLYALPFVDPNGDGIISNSEVIWKFKTGNEIWSSVGLAHGRVYVGSHDYYVYALPFKDPNSDGVISPKEVIWKFKTTDKIWSSPAVAGGKVFITSEDYKVWALCEETGALIWNYTMPLQVNEPMGSEYLYASPAVVNGKVYVGNFDLTLYCFGSGDSTPPNVSSVQPVNNSVDIPLNADIFVTFDDDICKQLITDSSVIVESSKGIRTEVKVSYDEAARTLKINPEDDLIPDDRYTVRLRSRFFQDLAGNTLDGNNNSTSDLPPGDDYIWYFKTSFQVGKKPRLENCSVTPTEGFLTTTFEFQTTYTDADGDIPETGEGRYIRVFLDGSAEGIDMEWANDTNVPEAYLLDRNFINGELYRLKIPVSSIGAHSYFIECSDGNNTKRSDEYQLPTVLNSPPVLSIPVQYVEEDVEFQLDLSKYVKDIDNNTNSLVFSEDSGFCEIDDHHFLTGLFTDDRNLSFKTNVSVSDGINEATQNVLFIIATKNDPPRLKNGIVSLPPATVYEDTMYIYHLSDYIEDPDTPLQLLTVDSNSKFATPVGMDLYLLYPNTMLADTVTITVTDGQKGLITDLEVTIIPVNDVPVINVPELRLKEDESARVNLGLFINDEESSPTELEIKASSRVWGEINIVAGLWLTMSYYEGITEDYLNITVIDGNLCVTQTVRVIIIPVNDPPGLTAPTAELVTDDDTVLYNFTVWYSDEELLNKGTIQPKVELILDGETYSLSLLMESELNEKNRLYGIILGLEGGTHHYLFSADDGAGEKNSVNHTEIFELEVASVEDTGDDDTGTGSKKLDVTYLGELRNLLYIIVIICAIIVLILINAKIYYSRTRRHRRKIEPPPPEQAEAVPPGPPVVSEEKPDEAQPEPLSTEAPTEKIPMAAPVTQPAEKEEDVTEAKAAPEPAETTPPRQYTKPVTDKNALRIEVEKIEEPQEQEEPEAEEEIEEAGTGPGEETTDEQKSSETTAEVSSEEQPSSSESTDAGGSGS